MKIQYNFRKTRESKRENYINKIVEIIEEYKAKGINRLTVRQLYYQLVSRGFHESDGSKNEGRSYGRTFDACSMGRQDGRIDWDVIEDRSREMITYNMWASPSAIISASARQYREDYWKKQKWRPEVWIEKQALIGLLEATCREYQVPLYTPRGFNSISNMFEAGQRFKDHIENDQTPIVIYLGDLDPAGEEMTEVARRQLAQYAGEPGDEYDPEGEPCDIEVRRIAMNPGQADRRTSFKLKKDDSKFPKYFANIGAAFK